MHKLDYVCADGFRSVSPTTKVPAGVLAERCCYGEHREGKAVFGYSQRFRLTLTSGIGFFQLAVQHWPRGLEQNRP
jgi:hypothetical protein